MEYLLKASIVVSIFYICFQFLVKRETFFNHNRWYLIIGLVVAFIFPFIVIPVYIPVELETPILSTYSISTPLINENISITNQEPIFNGTQFLVTTYSIGFGLLLLQFIFQFGSLISLLLKHPKNNEGIYTYVIVKNKISPFSFFKWIVYNPENYTNKELKLILAHEKIHVNQFHSIDILFAQLATIFFWFNPFIWLYRNEVRQNLEYIADAIAQTKTKDHKEYQRLLLKTGISNDKNLILSNNFYNSKIKKRIVMLNKSKSSTIKKWRYLLILPILTGLLMSMNVEKVYVEDTSNHSTESNETIEFIINKNTSDDQLNQMIATIKGKGGNLVFEDVKRNSIGELTGIFLKLNNHSYGGGDSKSSIDPFIIYKELYGNGGGYVGRPHAATMHFDVKESHEERLYQELEERAISKMIKLGLKINKVGKEEEKNKNTYSFLLSEHEYNPKDKTTKDLEDKNIIVNVISKNTSDAELDKIKESLKKEGVHVTFRGVERNSNNEITALKIEAKSKNSNANYSIESDRPINPIKIVFDSKNDTIALGNSNGNNVYVYSIEEEYEDEHEDEAETKVIIRTKGKKGKVNTIKQTKNVQVFSDDDDTVEIIMDDTDQNETIIVNGKKIETKGNDQVIIKKNLKNVWVTDKNGNKDVIAIENHGNGSNFHFSENDKEPLIILDGNVISKDDMIKIDAHAIKSVDVLKNESAIKLYGNKGKDGVIIITSKGNSAISSTSEDKAKSPWKVTTAVSTVQYIDDDSDDHMLLAYISKFTSDKILDDNKTKFQSIGLSVKYSGIKRNKSGDIIKIKIKLKDKEGKEASASFASDDGIYDIEYGLKNGQLIVRSHN